MPVKTLHQEDHRFNHQHTHFHRLSENETKTKDKYLAGVLMEVASIA